MRLGRVSSGDSRCWVDQAVLRNKCGARYGFRQIDELRSNDKHSPSTMTCTSDLLVERDYTQPSKTNLATNTNNIIYIHDHLQPTKLPQSAHNPHIKKCSSPRGSRTLGPRRALSAGRSRNPSDSPAHTATPSSGLILISSDLFLRPHPPPFLCHHPR